MQPTGDFIASSTKLSAGVQYGHNDFESRALHLRVHIYRDTPPVIDHRNAAVAMDVDFDPVAIARQSFVDRIVDDFVNEVVQRFDICPTHIHARATAYCFQTFQDLDIFGFVAAYFGYQNITSKLNV
jgi:hypothetical protein